MKFYAITILSVAFFYSVSVHAQNKPAVAQSANTTLSNLANPTKINVSLLPGGNGNHNLGNSTNAWRNFYLDSNIYIGGTKFLSRPINNSIAIGFNTLKKIGKGNANIAIGNYALSANTTGYSNVAIGLNALYVNTTGNHLVAIGDSALFNQSVNNSNDYDNTAIGFQALYANIDGHGNTATGTGALFLNQNGASNTANGAYSLYLNNGYYNTACGVDALTFQTSGNDNTANGFQAGLNVTVGSDNVFDGFLAGDNVKDGGGNVFVGAFTNSGTAGHITNGTAIGYQATVLSNNHVHIGNASVTSIGGQVGWSTLSDARIKNNIQQNVPGLAFINLLKPVTYHYDVNKQDNILGRKTKDWNGKYDIEKIQFTGFVAQDVEAAAKKIGYDFSGVDVPKNDKDLYSLRYSDFVVPLVKAVQELSKMNDTKDSILQIQNNKIADLENRLAKIEALMNVSESTNNSQQSTAISSASLSQNIPNPFSNSTTINYSLPVKFSSAKIIITDKNGNALKQINLSNKKGSVNVDAATLSSGAYQYSLYVDGKLIASKQMEHIK